MSWIRLDDQFADHPKFLEIREDLADAAMAMWARALGYCNKHETDGAIPRGALRQLSYHPSPMAVAEELVRVGLWVATDRGWAVHDYIDYQRTSAELAEQRILTAEQRRLAGIKSGESRRRKRNVDHSPNGARTKREQNANEHRTGDEQNANKTRTPSPIPIPEDDPTDHLASLDATLGGASHEPPLDADGHSGDATGPSCDFEPVAGPSTRPSADRPAVGAPGASNPGTPTSAPSPRPPASQGQRTGKPRRGRRGATDVSPAEQRYRAAYEAGVRDAAPGHGFSLPPGKIGAYLGQALQQHARGPDGPLTGDALDAWIRRTACEFRRAVDGSGQYWSGYGVPGFVRWLNSGRPRAASGPRAPSRVDDRPERYGETREEFEARMDRDQARFLERTERERAARLAAMTPEQRAAEEELPL